MDPLKLMPGGPRLGSLPSLGAARPMDAAAAGGANGAVGGASFADALQSAMDQVQALQDTANQEAVKVATGQSQDLHTAMIATEKATLALDLTVQVRNKVLEAYQEIMRLPV